MVYNMMSIRGYNEDLYHI